MKLRLQGNLWHHKHFQRFWFGDSVSQVTAQVTAVAMPFVALRTLSATPIEMGELVAIQFLAFPILGLFVGVWADRYRKRPIMVLANVGRMFALGSIPLASVLHTLSINQLFIVAAITGVCTVFFDVCYQSYLPVLIHRDDLLEGNSKLQLSASAAQPLGQSIGGFLVDLVTAARAISVDVAGFLVSAVALLSIRKPEPKPDPVIDRNFFREMKEGAKVVLGSRILSSIASCTATSNLGSQIAYVALVIFAIQTLQMSGSALGITYAVGSIGSLLGAWIAAPVSKRLGLGLTIVLSSAASIGLLISPLALYSPPILILSISQFIVGALVVIFNINQVSLRQAITSDDLQGRMNATMRTIVWGTIPVGSVLGGFLVASRGVVPTIIVGSVLSTLAFVWVLISPVLELKEIPKQQGYDAEVRLG